ncbi:MAG: B12-binding domain-containing radical SAM protein [Candidatus Hodarchaeota archaeon]
MRILFINPYFRYFGKDIFPLGLAYIASIAQNNNEVKIIDENLGKTKIEDELAKFKPDTVALTATTPSYPRAIEIAKLSKKRGALTIMGGVHVTFRPASALRLGIDVVVRGEGERVFAQLLSNYPALEDVKGISFKKNGQIQHNPDCELIQNLDSLPNPAYHLFELERYKIISSITSRGCPYNCTYCSATHFWRKKVRYRSIPKVIEEIKLLNQKYNFRLFRFMDSSFTIHEKRTKELCQAILDEDLQFNWSCEARPDQLSNELLETMFDAGCRLVCLGVDSASQEILNRSQRKVQSQEIWDAITRIKAKKMQVRAYVTFGFPGETIESVKQTITYLQQYQPSQILLSLATAYPGTKLTENIFVNVPDGWRAKFHGHAIGGDLILPESMNAKQYMKAADFMFDEIKKINKQQNLETETTDL